MTKTDKNLIVTTIFSTLYLLIFAIIGIIKLYHDKNSYVAYVILFALLIAYVLFRKGKTTDVHRRVKIIDLDGTGYPIGMDHQDEREWALMLHAHYIGQRVSSIPLVLLLFLPDIFVNEFHLQSSSNLTLSLMILGILLTVLIREWTSTIVFLYLERR